MIALFVTAIGVTVLAVLGIVVALSAERCPCDRDGHLWKLQLDDPSRLYLRCQLCDVETPGWQLYPTGAF